MENDNINIVWLKRDLRTQDHAALHAAEKAGIPYRIIYIFEPSLTGHPDTSQRHLQFNYHALLEMNNRLKPYQREVDIYYAEALEVFRHLLKTYRVNSVYSYRESGTRSSWNRDKAVRQCLVKNSAAWHEFQRDGIERGIKNRNGWDARWYKVMHEPVIKNEYSINSLQKLPNQFPLTQNFLDSVKNWPASFQPAGESYAWRYLGSFTRERGHSYHYHISKPAQSRYSSGRLSPYLAWGCLSIRQAYQHIRKHDNYEPNKKAFSGILTRLKWHCHFIQKFEVDCDYETVCINRGYESLEHKTNESHLAAWKTGQTGFPLIDACMRCLHETGWLNFRMRAMLVSFLCHHLDQDWREGAHILARLFLDYEPGIHYPQFQMQAGTTGVNTVRIYNPVKQSLEHDPDGEFIKKWLPELKEIPKEFIHEPWLMSEFDQSLYNVVIGRDYPSPIIDYMQCARDARAKIWGHRKNPEVKAERERIIRLHTRNNRSTQTVSGHA